LDCNSHRKPISVGYAWRESFETARIHGNKLPYARTDNNCHLALLRGNKLCDGTTQRNAGVNGDKWQRKVRARGGKKVFHLFF